MYYGAREEEASHRRLASHPDHFWLDPSEGRLGSPDLLFVYGQLNTWIKEIGLPSAVVCVLNIRGVVNARRECTECSRDFCLVLWWRLSGLNS